MSEAGPAAEAGERMETPDTILESWFGSESSDAAVAEQRSSLWWSKDPKTDDEIRSRFETLALAAESCDLDDWRSSADGRLALILLTDQFPRNIYRGTPAAFRFDRIALNLCLEGLRTRADRSLRPIRKVFFYLPLEQSEDLEHQRQSVRLFRDLADDVSVAPKPVLETYVDCAHRHQVIIERFGRFPPPELDPGPPVDTGGDRFLGGTWFVFLSPTTRAGTPQLAAVPLTAGCK
jgi:uncharacterized protein (DUF924 family)